MQSMDITLVINRKKVMPCRNFLTHTISSKAPYGASIGGIDMSKLQQMDLSIPKKVGIITRVLIWLSNLIDDIERIKFEYWGH